MKRIIALVLCMCILSTGCGMNKNGNQTIDNLEETHIGGAVLKIPSKEPSESIYEDSGIIKTNEYKPFTKKMIIYGITFVAKDEVSDEFMLKVAKTVKAMFAKNEKTDSNLQENVLQNMYKYNAMIPIVKGEFKLSKDEKQSFAKVEKENSICDIIMEGSKHQTLEVVEHILHTVTDVGLHYALQENWGVTKESTIYKYMKEAIDKKYFNISGYKDIPEGSIKERILIQEFSYWVITSAWDIQETYGLGEKEWALKNSTRLKEQLPDAYKLYEQDIPRIISVPSKEILDSF